MAADVVFEELEAGGDADRTVRGESPVVPLQPGEGVVHRARVRPGERLRPAYDLALVRRVRTGHDDEVIAGLQHHPQLLEVLAEREDPLAVDVAATPWPLVVLDDDS